MHAHIHVHKADNDGVVGTAIYDRTVMGEHVILVNIYLERVCFTLEHSVRTEQLTVQYYNKLPLLPLPSQVIREVDSFTEFASHYTQ